MQLQDVHVWDKELKIQLVDTELLQELFLLQCISMSSACCCSGNPSCSSLCLKVWFHVVKCPDDVIFPVNLRHHFKTISRGEGLWRFRGNGFILCFLWMEKTATIGDATSTITIANTSYSIANKKNVLEVVQIFIPFKLAETHNLVFPI